VQYEQGVCVLKCVGCVFVCARCVFMWVRCVCGVCVDVGEVCAFSIELV